MTDLIDEDVMRALSRKERRAHRASHGKCAGCAWPANTLCDRNHCPQGIALVLPDYIRQMAELERTCHTPEQWQAAGERMLAKAIEIINGR